MGLGFFWFFFQAKNSPEDPRDELKDQWNNLHKASEQTDFMKSVM